MSDKRSAKRRNIIYYLRLYDRSTDELIGQLVDITTGGLKLVCETPLTLDTPYSVRMVLPEPINGKNEIFFDIKSIWCKKDVNPNFYGVGFHYEHIAEEDLEIIQGLIYDFSFND